MHFCACEIHKRASIRSYNWLSAAVCIALDTIFQFRFGKCNELVNFGPMWKIMHNILDKNMPRLTKLKSIYPIVSRCIRITRIMHLEQILQQITHIMQTLLALPNLPIFIGSLPAIVMERKHSEN